MTPGEIPLLAVTGLVAGAVNAVAGGGSLLSFPVLLALGYPSVQANVTNTVALFPGYAGSLAGGRDHLVGQAVRLAALVPITVLGAAAGVALLLNASTEQFDRAVPVLVLLSCGLLAVQPRLARRVQVRQASRTGRPTILYLSVGLAAVYGAYFGAGLGVLLLAALGILLPEPLQVVNVLKNALSVLINGLAMLAFALFGPVAWSAVAVVSVGSVVGGYVGARLATRIPAGVLRACVVTVGVGVALVLFVTS